MSYPEPVYFGDGEVSARLRRTDAAPDITYPNGVRVEYLATGGGTDGHFGLYRWNFSTAASGPAAHFHRTMSESFFVLAGTVKLFDGDAWVDGNPGDFLHVPPGGLHGFRNESGAPATMLLMFSPAGPREDYFEGLKAVAEGLVMTDEERDAFYVAHDNFWV